MHIMNKCNPSVNELDQQTVNKRFIVLDCTEGQGRSLGGSARSWCTIKALLERSICMVVFGFVLTSHAETSPPTDPKSVMMLLGEQDLARCQFLGEVAGSSLDSENDAAYMDRLMSARNKLRNETAKLGGNTVHVGNIDARNAGQFEIPGTDKKITYTGKAYFCK